MIGVCSELSIQVEIFELTAGSALAPELCAHLERCAHCRAHLEQRRRFALTWSALEPTPLELSQAHARFAASPHPRSPLRWSAPALALAVVLGATLASAAGHVAFGLRAIQLGAWRPFAGASPPLPRARAHSRSVGGRSVSAGAPRLPPAAHPFDVSPSAESDPGVLVHSEPPRVGSSGERAAPSLPRARSSGRAPRAAHRAAPVAVTSGAASAGPPASEELRAPESRDVRRVRAPRDDAGTWREAAQALRALDYTGAERAFGVLAASSNAVTRDAARLARAQLWLARGESSAARAELGALAVSGATPFVRQRATSALRALER